MREIKFRAWDKEKKEWVKNLNWSECEPQANVENGILTMESNDFFNWSQYTGRKDKNGKEIFEGDVVEMEEPVMESDVIKCEIVFYEGTFCAKWDRESQVTYFPLSECRLEEENVEIIGNVYSNPELLSTPIR